MSSSNAGIGSSSLEMSPRNLSIDTEETSISSNVREREGLLDSQEGNSNEPTDETLLRERAKRHIGSIGRHFNILDRLFNRATEVGAQHGASFDGVFSNLTAKPNATDNMNEDATEDIPPTYNIAANDIVPSYYGANSEGSAMYYDEICIEGLPIGNVANLIWNIIVSTGFQFIGFLITYVLHTSHAAKQGSRFGLGLTFIGYSYSMIPNDVKSKVGKDNVLNRVQVENPNDFDDIQIDTQSGKQDTFQSDLSHGLEEEKQNLPFLAILVGILGLYISIKSLIDYVKVKRMEEKYLAQDPV